MNSLNPASLTQASRSEPNADPHEEEIVIPRSMVMCVICQDPPRHAVSTDNCCSSLLCESCAEKWENSSGNGTCPMCRDEDFDYFANEPIRRILSMVRIFLCLRECGAVLRGDELDSHDDVCERMEIECPFKCGANAILRGKLKDHLSSCPVAKENEEKKTEHVESDLLDDRVIRLDSRVRPDDDEMETNVDESDETDAEDFLEDDEEDYFADVPGIVKFVFELSGRSDAANEVILSNENIRGLTDQYLLRKNEEFGDWLTSDPELFLEINGFDDESVRENFGGACEYGDLRQLFRLGGHADEFAQAFNNFIDVATELEHFSFDTLLRALGYMNKMHRSRLTSSDDDSDDDRR